MALNGLSHIVTPELARDLAPEMVAMLNHSRPHIRKRAVLAMFKVFTKYPDILPQSMSRLRDKLDDPDPGRLVFTVADLESYSNLQALSRRQLMSCASWPIAVQQTICR